MPFALGLKGTFLIAKEVRLTPPRSQSVPTSRVERNDCSPQLSEYIGSLLERSMLLRAPNAIRVALPEEPRGFQDHRCVSCQERAIRLRVRKAAIVAAPNEAIRFDDPSDDSTCALSVLVEDHYQDTGEERTAADSAALSNEIGRFIDPPDCITDASSVSCSQKGAARSKDTRPPFLALSRIKRPSGWHDDLSSDCEEEVTKSTRETRVPVTTLFLKRLPFKMLQQDLKLALDALGFGGTYNLLYVPRCSKNTAGFGFVNFRAEELCFQFQLAFTDRPAWDNSFPKNVIVQPAKAQGMEATLASIKSRGKGRVRGDGPLLF